MEKRNLIIGGFTNYGINQLKPWVLSAKEVAGKNTDIVLVYGKTSQQTLDWLEEQGVLLWPMKELPHIPPHVMRFHALYEFMRNKWMEYDYVVATDVKDVYFQKDPIKQLVGNKLVVATEEDCQEALNTVERYRSNGFRGHVYLMPVGGVESVYILNNRRVAEFAMKHGLRYSDRLQVPLFKNEWGT